MGPVDEGGVFILQICCDEMGLVIVRKKGNLRWWGFGNLNLVESRFGNTWSVVVNMPVQEIRV